MTLEPEPLDLCALVARILEEARLSLERRDIVLICSFPSLTVRGDALRLEQVVQNLLQNALKYSPALAPVRVELARREGWATLTVSDEGIGIPAASLPKLSQRFYRADNVDTRQVSGLGIGLYVVKEIVALHGGTIEVQSVEGAGSRFTVLLPLADSVPSPDDAV